MPSESTDMRRPVKNQPTDPGAAATMQPPKPTDLLPCPRCGSASTKFCYYNNYNLSQPRYFCKGCRRYWTQGGTLRCVPVGGGTRKSGSSSSSSSASKRSRSSSASSTTTTSTNSSNSTTSNPTITTTTTTTTHEPVPVPVSASGSEVHHPEHVKVEHTIPYGLNLNEKFQPVMNDCSGNFMSLLNCQEPPVLGMGMSGYGSDFGYGFYDMGLGFGGRGGGAGVWSYPGIGNGNVTDGVAVVGGDANPGCNTWQVGHDVGGNGSGNGNGGAGGVDDGVDYFGWPGLAISTPGKAFK